MSGAGEESGHPGVAIERRTVLRVAGLACAGGLAGGLTGPFARAARGEERAEKAIGTSKGFDELAALWKELAREYLVDAKAATGVEEDVYLYRLAAAIARLPLAEMPPMQRTVFDRSGVQTGPAFGAERIFVIVLRLQPGAVIRAHDHPAHNVVTAGLEGACRYRHFHFPEDVERPPRDDFETPFQLRETRAGLLTPGRWSELARARDNVHEFQAGSDGATILDFTTEAGDAAEGFSQLAIGQEPLDAFSGVHEARWAEKVW